MQLTLLSSTLSILPAFSPSFHLLPSEWIISINYVWPCEIVAQRRCNEPSVVASRVWAQGVVTGRAINGGRGLSRNGIKRFTTGPQISTDAMDECKGGSRCCTNPVHPLYLSSVPPPISPYRPASTPFHHSWRSPTLPFHPDSERVQTTEIILSRRGSTDTWLSEEGCSPGIPFVSCDLRQRSDAWFRGGVLRIVWRNEWLSSANWRWRMFCDKLS